MPHDLVDKMDNNATALTSVNGGQVTRLGGNLFPCFSLGWFASFWTRVGMDSAGWLLGPDDGGRPSLFVCAGCKMIVCGHDSDVAM